MEFTSSHKCIKNTSTCGVILTDYLLDTSKLHIQPKLQERSPCTGRVKKKESEWGRAVPLGGICEREKIPSPWEPPSPTGRSAGQKGRFRGSAESQQLAWSRQNRLRPALIPGNLTAYPSLRVASAGVHSGSVVKLRLQQTALGIGLKLTTWKQLEGARVWSRLRLGVYTEQSPSPL